MYLGPNIPQNAFIAQINEKYNLARFYKLKYSCIVKIFLRHNKVIDTQTKIIEKEISIVKRFLEIVKNNSELDFKFIE